jgi:hypothetical protein
MARFTVTGLLLGTCAGQTPQLRVRDSITGCSSPQDCSLNGKCVNGVCDCNVAFKGDSCEILNLQNGSQSALGYHAVEHTEKGQIKLSSWGGSAHRGANGVYHLIASEIGDGVGMTLWGCASRIIHATSPDPLHHPFVKKRVLFENFSHEPRCAFNPQGGLVCYFAHNPIYHLNDKCAGANGTTPASGGCDCANQVPYSMPTMMSYVSDIDDDSAEWSTPVHITAIGSGTDSNICECRLQGRADSAQSSTQFQFCLFQRHTFFRTDQCTLCTATTQAPTSTSSLPATGQRSTLTGCTPTFCAMEVRYMLLYPPMQARLRVSGCL